MRFLTFDNIHLRNFIQNIINHLYRYPLADFKRKQRFGGWLNYQKVLREQHAMKQAANLILPAPSHPDGLPVYFLTGKNYLYQTLFCIKSLAKVSTEPFHYILIDDGTFTEEHIAQIERQLPGAWVWPATEINAILADKLPRQKFPAINKKRDIYPHLKKLTDIHFLPGNNWKLVLDSDMLFWQEPSEIINWLKNPEQPIHMLDCVESYGYSTQLMQQLCNQNIPKLLNVGVIGLNSQQINWNDLENWITVLEEQHGASYYLEQALTAMLVAGQTATVLPQANYRVNPDLLADGAVLHHYVDLSKKIYFLDAWKKVTLN